MLHEHRGFVLITAIAHLLEQHLASKKAFKLMKSEENHKCVSSFQLVYHNVNIMITVGGERQEK